MIRATRDRRGWARSGLVLAAILGVVVAMGVVSPPAEAATRPGTPTSVTATASFGRVVVSWRPGPSGGATITGYQVASRRLWSSGLWSAWTTISLSATARSRAISFPNGTTVQVKVRALNRLGAGPYSTPIRHVVGVPGRVPTTTATAGVRSITVTWGAAAANGDDITGYVVRLRARQPGGGGTWTTRSVGATTRSTTWTSLSAGTPLTPGQQYETVVAAKNRFGVGADGPLRTATPTQDTTAPPTPSGLVAVALDAAASLSWTPVVASDLAGYRVYRAASPSGPWTLVTADLVTTPTTEVSGLLNGQQAFLAVTSVDTTGNESVLSTAVSVTPQSSTPPPPAGVTATPGKGFIQVSWSPVQWSSEIVGFIVYRSTDPAGPWTTQVGIAANVFSTNMAGAADTTYYFMVRTRGSGQVLSGDSAVVSARQLDAIPPPPPTNLSTSPGDGSIVLSWTASDAPDVVSYRVQKAVNPSGAWTIVVPDVSAPATSTTLSGLTNGTTYRFRMTAIDAAGNESSLSTTTTGTPEAPDTAAPGPVTSLAASAFGSAVALSWTNPVDADLAGVVIRRATGPVPPSSPEDGDAVGTTGAGITSYVDVTVAPGTQYSYAAFARDEVPNYSPATTVTVDSGALGGGNAAALAVGLHHACALTLAGGVVCWGSNDYGQIGSGSATVGSAAPTGVTGLSAGVVSVTAGREFSCALKGTGGVVCWGARLAGAGNLGDGQITASDSYSAVPVQVAGLSNGVVAISSFDTTTCALKASGAVWCWGDIYGQIIPWAFGQDRSNPLEMTGFDGPVAALSVGFSHACALLVSGTPECWGANGFGELGRAVPFDPDPAPVSGFSSGVAGVSAGNHVTCLVTTTGAAWCFGNGAEGALGNGGTTSSATPVAVSGLATGVARVSVGEKNACAVTTDGASWCWGPNTSGQLGNGTQEPSLVPVPVTGLGAGQTRTVATVGFSTACVVRTDLTAMCWGDNSGYLLGNPDATAASTVPVAVVGLD